MELKKQIEDRLSELYIERGKGSQVLVDLELQLTNLRQTVNHIDGAIRALSELLGESEQEVIEDK